MIKEISEVNPDCLWQFTTNGHWKLTDIIKKELSKIKIECITLSVDSLVPETYSQLRKRGDLSVVLQTVLDLKKYLLEEHPSKDTLHFEVNMTVQKLNWKEIPAFIRYGKEIGLHTSIWPLFVPEDLSVMSEDEKERYRVLDYLFSELPKEDFSLAKEFIGSLIESLPKSAMKKKYKWAYLNALAEASY